jgi:hypothetical protein
VLGALIRQGLLCCPLLTPRLAPGAASQANFVAGLGTYVKDNHVWASLVGERQLIQPAHDSTDHVLLLAQCCCLILSTSVPLG